MADLFEREPVAAGTPDARMNLAARMRPQTLAEFAGQSGLLAEGRLLQRLIQTGKFSALLFYGPPGTGKTTLAHCIARQSGNRFTAFNAVEPSVAELRRAVEQAVQNWRATGQRTL